MLGQQINDPDGIEGPIAQTKGLGYLPVTTTLFPEKQLVNREGELWNGAKVSGYEIHAGISQVAGEPMLMIEGQPEGCRSEQVLGTYLHGLFDNEEALPALLAWAGLSSVESFDYQALKEKEIERLADAVEAAMDWEKFAAVIGITRG